MNDVVSPQPISPGRMAGLGMHVLLEVTYTDETEQLSLDIVEDRLADFEHGFLGQSTPLAKAILGRRAGEEVAYQNGDAQTVRILDVTRSDSAPSEENAEKREETMRKVAREVDRTNAINFASSFNGKWGDYDPSTINDEW
jgi:hypothetical protein